MRLSVGDTCNLPHLRKRSQPVPTTTCDLTCDLVDSNHPLSFDHDEWWIDFGHNANTFGQMASGHVAYARSTQSRSFVKNSENMRLLGLHSGPSESSMSSSPGAGSG